MMKRGLIITALGMLLGTTVTLADTIKANGFRFRHIKELVVLQFDVQTPDKTVRNDYHLVVTPQLSASGHTQTLEPFIVYGKRNLKREQQRNLLNKEVWDSRLKLTNNDRLAYADTLQFQPWMNDENCVLRLLIQEEGCCQVKDREPLNFGNLKLEELFRPHLVPVPPLVSEVEKAQTKYLFLRRWGTDSVATRGVSVRFPINRIELLPEFSSNQENLQQIIDAITLVRSTPSAAVKQISITGYASPEGNTDRNLFLSKERALALRDYIKQTLNVPDEQFRLTSGGEDWQGLRQLVEESDMTYKKEILNIIDHTPKEQRKSQLQQLAGGRPYQSICDVFFPQLRDACYIHVWYTEKPDTTASIINEAISDIADEQYEDALKRLEGVKNDKRSWNVMGIALMMLGKDSEAIHWLQKAADAGDENAKANLEQMNNNQ